MPKVALRDTSLRCTLPRRFDKRQTRFKPLRKDVIAGRLAWKDRVKQASTFLGRLKISELVEQQKVVGDLEGAADNQRRCLP